MVVNNNNGDKDKWDKWLFELGPEKFDGPQGPLAKYGGRQGLLEFNLLREACLPLCAGAAGIPTMALRGGRLSLLPLLKHLDALKKVIPYAEVLNANFQPYMDKFVS